MGLTALILVIIGIILAFLDLSIGLILIVISNFLAEKGKKNKEKYSSEAYSISLVSMIIVGILLFCRILLR